MALSDKDGAKKLREALESCPDKQTRKVVADKVQEKIEKVGKEKS
jgi:hypothetical protein